MYFNAKYKKQSALKSLSGSRMYSIFSKFWVIFGLLEITAAEKNMHGLNFGYFVSGPAGSTQSDTVL